MKVMMILLARIRTRMRRRKRERGGIFFAPRRPRARRLGCEGCLTRLRRLRLRLVHLRVQFLVMVMAAMRRWRGKVDAEPSFALNFFSFSFIVVFSGG